MNKHLLEILDIFAKQAFDKGMKCVGDNIDEKGLWKEQKKTVDMTEERKQAHDQIIELWKGRVKWEDIADIIENATYRQGIALDLNDDKICEIAKNIVQAITQAQKNMEG